MPTDRWFLDTSFMVALLDQRDQCHARAKFLRPRLDQAEIWTTEAVLVEIGNTFSRRNRVAAVEFIEICYQTPNIQVVVINTPRLLRALNLYKQRDDKNWGMTDCLSFEVMREHNLTDALTADRHFVQAGFRALLLEEA